MRNYEGQDEDGLLFEKDQAILVLLYDDPGYYKHMDRIWGTEALGLFPENFTKYDCSTSTIQFIIVIKYTK